MNLTWTVEEIRVICQMVIMKHILDFYCSSMDEKEEASFFLSNYEWLVNEMKIMFTTKR